jgi:DNA repair protein RecO (recombination protein O)
MLHHTRGIVFHQVKYSESSIIAKFYTEQFGLQSYIIRGLRNKKSLVKPALLQPLTLVDMVVDRKEKRDIQHIKELKVARTFKSIPLDIRKSSIIVFLNDLLYNVIREQESNPDLFGFLFQSIEMLDSIEDGIAYFHLKFLVKLTKYLGFYPKNNFSEKDHVFDLQEGMFTDQILPDSVCIVQPYSGYFAELINHSSYSYESFHLSPAIRSSLLESLLRYYHFQIPGMKEIKSHIVLYAVLND